ncbi:recombinase family protein [Rhodococcus sp. ARC_M13]|uniref:recombinase family protein n=1 Tax=Rhodococcus sp. ARC_M13 TaxID=2928855 RepID=UPI002436ADA8|nr:recombinase family protein [Rhodococcus sp. ARC_M13]
MEPRRLGRSVGYVIDTVHNLGERGIAFRSLTEGFDTTAVGGEFLFHIMAARRQGRHGSRPTVMTPSR